MRTFPCCPTLVVTSSRSSLVRISPSSSSKSGPNSVLPPVFFKCSSRYSLLIRIFPTSFSKGGRGHGNWNHHSYENTVILVVPSFACKFTRSRTLMVISCLHLLLHPGSFGCENSPWTFFRYSEVCFLMYVSRPPWMKYRSYFHLTKNLSLGCFCFFVWSQLTGTISKPYQNHIKIVSKS